MSWKQQQYPWKYTNVFCLLQTCWFLLWIWQVYYELHIQSHDTPQIGEVVAKGRVLVLVQMDGWLLVIHPNTPFCLSLGPTYHSSPQSHLENTKLHKFLAENFGNFQDGLLKNFVSLVIPGFMVLEMTWNPGAWMVTDLSGGLPGDCFREVVLKGLGRQWIGWFWSGVVCIELYDIEWCKYM